MLDCCRERQYEINKEDKVTLITFDDDDFIDIDVGEDVEDINFQTICIYREDIYKIYEILKEQDEDKKYNENYSEE